MGLLDGPLQAAFQAVASTIGTTATLTRSTRKYDARTSTNLGTESTSTLRLILGTGSSELVNADATKKTDLEVMVEARDTDGNRVTPDTDTDRLTLNGVIWRIVKVAPINGSTEAVAYKLTLNK